MSKLEKAPKESEEKKEEGNKKERGEEMLGKMDEKFEELLDIAANSPEAKRAAIVALVEHIRETAAQVKDIRDAKHLQEIKVLMLKNWRELQELTAGDSALLASIQEWGRRFVEQKVLLYEMIEAVKDEMADKAHEIQIAWNAAQVDLGAAAGYGGHDGKHALEQFWDRFDVEYTNPETGGFDLDKVNIFSTPGLEHFMKSLTDLEHGYSDSDIAVQHASRFLENANELVSKLTAAATSNPLYPGEKDPEKALQHVKAASAQMNLVSREIRDASKIFKVIKKLRDTSFLPLYNEMPQV